MLERCLAILLGLLLVGQPAVAARQNLSAVRQAALDYVYSQLQGQPGTIDVSMGNPDNRLNLPPCASMQGYLPIGARLVGRTSVGVRCMAGANWTITLPTQISIVRDVVVAARPLGYGQTLGPADIATRPMELAELPATVLIDPGQAVGRALVSAVQAGTPLRNENFRAPYAVLQNQSVRLVAESTGFRVESQGKALGNALVGQVVGVKTDNGQVVQGVVQGPGLVVVPIQ